MGFFSDDHPNANAYDQVYNGSGEEHKSSWSHELIGGAAAFEAARAYENHCASEGKPTSHAMAKELLAGIAGAEVDKLVESKGLDFIDREKAKRHAEKELEQNVLSQEY